MGSIPFAFSVHHFISSVGADAGFAAIIGLAILVLLYFAQARETSSLRDQAAEAAQRVAQLEAQISRLGRPQPSSVVPPPAGAGQVVVSAPGRSAAAAASVPSASPAPVRRPTPAPALVGAPAGLGAPALSAATRLIPASAVAASGAPAVAASAPAAPASEPAVAPSPGDPPAAAPPTGEPAWDGSGAGAHEPAGPPPATAAGGAANGANRNRAMPAAPAAAAPAAAAAARAQGPPAVQFRPPAAGVSAPAPAAGRRPPNDGRRSGAGRALMLAVGLIGAAVVVAVLLVATSGGTNASSSSSRAAQTSNAPRTHTRSSRARPQPAVVAPASVTVAVLNGTATSNLAHRVALKLTAAGYKQGTIATAPDQTHTSTVVAYLPGDRPQAIAVATSLKLGSASVQPVDQSNQAVACPPGATCAANVVVIVGSDLAATA